MAARSGTEAGFRKDRLPRIKSREERADLAPSRRRRTRSTVRQIPEDFTTPEARLFSSSLRKRKEALFQQRHNFLSLPKRSEGYARWFRSRQDVGRRGHKKSNSPPL